MTEIRPFVIAIPEAELTDLRDRLARTRWPDRSRSTTGRRAYRSPIVQESVAIGQTEYDWRATEARLNRLEQFTHRDRRARYPLRARPLPAPRRAAAGAHARLAGLRRRSSRRCRPADRPDRVRRRLRTLSRHPVAAGLRLQRKPADRAGASAHRRRWAQLMARLGYRRYGAAGSDWGTSVSTLLGSARSGARRRNPPHSATGRPDPATFDDLTPAERASLADLRAPQRTEDGYSLRALHPAADRRLRPGGLPGRALRLDRREVPLLERLRRGARTCPQPTADARRHHALLADRHRRVATRAICQPRSTSRERPLATVIDGSDLRPRGVRQPDLFVAEVRAFFRLVRP